MLILYMEEEIHIEEEVIPWWKGPLKYIMATLLILLLIIWYFPSQAIKIDPEPKAIPSISEVLPKNIEPLNNSGIVSRRDYLKLLTPNRPEIKQTADKIVTLACEGNKICHAKAIYYFVIENFQYVSDPTEYEYVKSAQESLIATGGDCDDASVLAANLLQAVGIHTRFVFIPGHVYIQAYLPDALRRYKTEDSDYVSLDLTCKNCKFGELPYSDLTDNKQIIG